MAHRYQLPLSRQAALLPMARSTPRQAGSERLTGPPTLTDLNEELQAAYDAQPQITRCALCTDFVFVGPAGEGRIAAAEHRREKHPDLPVKKRKRRNNFRPPKR